MLNIFTRHLVAYTNPGFNMRRIHLSSSVFSHKAHGHINENSTLKFSCEFENFGVNLHLALERIRASLQASVNFTGDFQKSHLLHIILE